jgi:hypothetical protein
MSPAEKQQRLQEIDAAMERAKARAEAERARVLEQSDTRAPWSGTVGEGVAPNDRERELALRVMNNHNRGDCSTAVLMTSIAKALATYRVELGHEERT